MTVDQRLPETCMSASKLKVLIPNTPTQQLNACVGLTCESLAVTNVARNQSFKQKGSLQNNVILKFSNPSQFSVVVHLRL